MQYKAYIAYVIIEELQYNIMLFFWIQILIYFLFLLWQLVGPTSHLRTCGLLAWRIKCGLMYFVFKSHLSLIIL